MDVTEDITCPEYETEVENERTDATVIEGDGIVYDESDIHNFLIRVQWSISGVQTRNTSIVRFHFSCPSKQFGTYNNG